MMFSVLKFITGFNVFDGAKLGKLVFYGILITIGLTIYHNAFKPKTTNNVQTQIVQADCNDKVFLGIKAFGLKLGVGYGK